MGRVTVGVAAGVAARVTARVTVGGPAGVAVGLASVPVTVLSAVRSGVAVQGGGGWADAGSEHPFDVVLVIGFHVEMPDDLAIKAQARAGQER